MTARTALGGSGAVALSFVAAFSWAAEPRSTRSSAKRPAPYTTWHDYAGGAESLQYSALKQITKNNVGRLQQAWFYPTTGAGIPFNPVIVDGVMYVLAGGPAIEAVDAATGKRIWTHPVTGNPNSRGINYWESSDRSDRRLIFSAGNYLQEINAKTGVTINTFGNDGRVDLREGLGRDPKSIRSIQSRNPGRVFGNFVIIGSVTGENFGSPPGDIRAYDVLTGKTAWTFHTIPRPGEFGYETWPAESYKYAGGANNWGEMAIDEARGILYVPLGSPTFDLYGADRKGANLFGNCIVALDAKTGKRLWHFQTVHHDLWDYDLTTAPKLLTVRHGGKKVDIVAQAAKNGYLYVFNRVTGQPIWPIEERPVPKSEVPGEESWPTQPVPTKPPPFSRQSFSADEVNPYLEPAERENLQKMLADAANSGVFTPSSHLRNHIQIPGAFGGANWGAAAVDPATGMLYVRSYDAPSIRQLTERRDPRLSAEATPEQRGFVLYQQNCSTCHGQTRTGIPRPRDMGMAAFIRTLRNGRGQMPAFDDDALKVHEIQTLAAYLNNPTPGEVLPANNRPATPPRQELAPGPPRPEGLRQFSGPFGAQWLSSGGLPAISPPWSEIVAYDLNEGTIKWRIPIGGIPALAEKGIKNTGGYRPTTGPVVTAGGLIFQATGGDQTLRAYDKDNGKLLWEKELEANPNGIPAVYEVGHRQYIVFCVAAETGTGSRTSAVFKNGKAEAQGYYAFALPASKPK